MINYKKITILTILLSLILTATPSIAQADVKTPVMAPKEWDITFSVDDPHIPGTIRMSTITQPNHFIYTINSKYNAESGCTTRISLSDEKTPINRQEDGYLCNAKTESNFLSSELDAYKYNEIMLAQREKISTSRIVKEKLVKKSKIRPTGRPLYNAQIKVNEFTVGVASCNMQQNCSYNSIPPFAELVYEKNRNLVLDATPLVELSDSQIIFSKFSDGVNQLPNFISEINTIKFYSAYNTVLYEVKPKTSPIYMSNFYSTKVPLRAYKVEICTNYEYCFTTRLEDSIATYLEEKKPARTFAINITNTNLANYQKVGLTVQNGNFETANFEKTLTLKYNLKESGNESVKATRVGTNHHELQRSNKINKNYFNPEICDDTTCLPATVILSSNCPNNPTICLTTTFTPIKKKTVISGQLIQPDGSPAPFGSLVFYPNRDYYTSILVQDFFENHISEESAKFQIGEFLKSKVYRSWPEYKKVQKFSADENGMFTFALDLDHYYSKVDRCNINSCLSDKTYLFNQTKYDLPNEGRSLLITVPSNEYTSKNKKDKTPAQLKPGIVINGKVLAEAIHLVKQETYGIPTPKYLAPGSYLQTFTSTGSTATKTLTDEQGNFSLTLPANFTRLEICSASNQCGAVSHVNKFYYLDIDQKDIPVAKVFTLPAPTSNIGMLRGKLYGGSNEIVLPNSKVNIPNKEVYLLNAKGELITTLKTASNGEFTKNLNYIIEKKITYIGSCENWNRHKLSVDCDSGNYNEINLSDIQLYFDSQVNYPYQVVSGLQTKSVMESVTHWMAALAVTLSIITGTAIVIILIQRAIKNAKEDKAKKKK